MNINKFQFFDIETSINDKRNIKGIILKNGIKIILVSDPNLNISSCSVGIGAGYLHDELDVEIIADGIHLPSPLLKLIYKIKGADHTALITDAMRGAGMPEGESILGNINNGIKVILEGGVAKMPDRSSFAGSVALADRLVRTMINMGEVPLVDAIKMITATPARIMKLSDKIGRLKKGMDADILVFNQDIEMQSIFIKGNQVK